jgi:hypothetical protein
MSRSGTTGRSTSPSGTATTPRPRVRAGQGSPTRSPSVSAPPRRRIARSLVTRRRPRSKVATALRGEPSMVLRQRTGLAAPGLGGGDPAVEEHEGLAALVPVHFVIGLDPVHRGELAHGAPPLCSDLIGQKRSTAYSSAGSHSQYAGEGAVGLRRPDRDRGRHNRRLAGERISLSAARVEGSGGQAGQGIQVRKRGAPGSAAPRSCRTWHRESCWPARLPRRSCRTR